jgi:hypothetical protein
MTGKSIGNWHSCFHFDQQMTSTAFTVRAGPTPVLAGHWNNCWATQTRQNVNAELEISVRGKV